MSVKPAPSGAVSQKPHTAGRFSRTIREVMLTAKWLAGILFLASIGAASAQQSRLPVKALRDDFAIFRHSLEEGHAGLYRYTPKAEMDAMFDRGDASLKAPMTSLEFLRVIAPIEAAIKCGHSGVRPSKSDFDRIITTAKLLPYSVKVIGGKVFVLRDVTGGKSHAGDEITSINGLKTGSLLEKMESMVECDADVQSLKPFRLSNLYRFNTALLSLIGLSAPYAVELKGSDGKVHRVKLAGLPRPELVAQVAARYPQDSPKSTPTDLTFSVGGKIAVLTVRSFGGVADREGRVQLGEFFDQAFSQMELNQTKALIIDLRGNGGGADLAGRELLQHLVDKPFNYYTDLILNSLTFSFTKYGPPEQPKRLPEGFAKLGKDGKYHNVTHPNVGMHDPARPTFLGPLYILADGGSFSTTCEFTSNLRYRRKAIFIGEETGGAFYGNNSGATASVILPHTGVTFFVPLQKYIMAVSGEPKRRGVLPDLPVTPSIQDFIKGRDRAMETAIRLATKAAR